MDKSQREMSAFEKNSKSASMYDGAFNFHFETHRFSTAKWEAMPEMRKLIISDLLNRYDFIGMHEEDVIALLGPETEGNQQTSFKGDHTYYAPDETMVYFIGQDMLEDVWLIFSLQDRRVIKVSFGVT